VSRPRPRPPRPELLRRPTEPFGWLQARLLHEGWFERIGPDATAVLVLLALAADERGASFYGRVRMAQRLGLGSARLDDALERLLRLGLVAHRPWRTGCRDGVWQLLPLAPRVKQPRDRRPMSIGAILAQLGLREPADGETR